MSNSATAKVTLGGVEYDVVVNQDEQTKQVDVSIKEHKVPVSPYGIVESFNQDGVRVGTGYKNRFDGAERYFETVKSRYPNHNHILWRVYIPERLAKQYAVGDERMLKARKILEDNLDTLTPVSSTFRQFKEDEEIEVLGHTFVISTVRTPSATPSTLIFASLKDYKGISASRPYLEVRLPISQNIRTLDRSDGTDPLPSTW